MATFPDYPQSHKSTVKPLTGITLDYSISGNLKGRNLYASSVYDIYVEYELISSTEKDFLESFWTLYQNDKNTITCDVDNHTYEVLFVTEPEFTRPTPEDWRCGIRLQGKRIS